MDYILERIQDECRTKTIKVFTPVRKFILDIESATEEERSAMFLEVEREAAELRGDVCPP